MLVAFRSMLIRWGYVDVYIHLYTHASACMSICSFVHIMVGICSMDRLEGAWCQKVIQVTLNLARGPRGAVPDHRLGCLRNVA